MRGTGIVAKLAGVMQFHWQDAIQDGDGGEAVCLL